MIHKFQILAVVLLQFHILVKVSKLRFLIETRWFIFFQNSYAIYCVPPTINVHPQNCCTIPEFFDDMDIELCKGARGREDVLRPILRAKRVATSRIELGSVSNQRRSFNWFTSSLTIFSVLFGLRFYNTKHKVAWKYLRFWSVNSDVGNSEWTSIAVQYSLCCAKL